MLSNINISTIILLVSSSYFGPKDLSTLRRARSNLVIGQRKLITAHRYALIWEVSPTDQKIWLYFVRISGGHLWLIYSWSCYMMVLQVLRSLHGWQFPMACLENLNSATFYAFCTSGSGRWWWWWSSNVRWVGLSVEVATHCLLSQPR